MIFECRFAALRNGLDDRARLSENAAYGADFAPRIFLEIGHRLPSETPFNGMEPKPMKAIEPHHRAPLQKRSHRLRRWIAGGPKLAEADAGAGLRAYPAPAEPIESEIPWATWGPVSRIIAKVLRPRPPAVIVLSLARSGSSWVGDMLGLAEDALYLREPFTQTDLAVNHRQVFDPSDHPPLESVMRRLADKAFLGLPDFRPKVVVNPGQWSLRDRRRRRVVIKEVNPRAGRWFIANYRPRVIFLLRHPAATAWSSYRQSWLGPTPADWEQRGREDRESQRILWDALKDYPAHTKVYFEDLCRDPVSEFRRLYDFAGLTWTDAVARIVAENGVESPQKADAWRNDAGREHLAALRRGFAGFDPGWSRWDDDWGMG